MRPPSRRRLIRNSHREADSFSEEEKEISGDDEFCLDESSQHIEVGINCALCKKDKFLKGPFISKRTSSATAIKTEYWFHTECLERNEFVVYDERKDFYYNLKDCIEKLV